MVRARTDIFCSRNRQFGGILIGVVGLMFILFLAALAKWIMQSAERKLGQQIGITTTLSKIDAAFVNYIAQNRRMPCPAIGTIASGLPNAGVESRNPATGLCIPANQSSGIVPWVTLGLSEDDAHDPWNGRITYRVDPALAGNLLLTDMSNCDASGTAGTGPGGICKTPTPPCSANPATCTAPLNFLLGKGLDVWNGIGGAAGWATRTNNSPAGSGAAYVIISHGPTGAGAYNSNGALQPGTVGPIAIVPPPTMGPLTQIAGNDEIPNMNAQALILPATIATTFRDAPYDTSQGVSHFDDYVSHPTLLSVLIKANLGPRAH